MTSVAETIAYQPLNDQQQYYIKIERSVRILATRIAVFCDGHVFADGLSRSNRSDFLSESDRLRLEHHFHSNYDLPEDDLAYNEFINKFTLSKVECLELKKEIDGNLLLKFLLVKNDDFANTTIFMTKHQENKTLCISETAYNALKEVIANYDQIPGFNPTPIQKKCCCIIL